MAAAQTLENVLDELVVAYPDHVITPGLQVAAISEGYYAAVHIFPQGVASRKIVAKAKASSAGLAIAEAMRIWRDIKANGG